MDTNQENMQINSFIKGMNTDTSVQMMSDDQYISAYNIRVFPNTDSNQQGELKSIEGVKKLIDVELPDFKIAKILNASTIRNYGVLIVENEIGEWRVLRLNYNGQEFEQNEDGSYITVIFKCGAEDRLGGINGIKKVSTVLRYEDDNNIKLYIADGHHRLMVLNIMNQNYSGDISEIQLFADTVLMPPIFAGFVSGNLKYSMVQYSYRLYSKNGIVSELSCPTKLIPIVSKNKGGDKDENAGVGVKLKIKTKDDSKILNRIQIYRVQYVENGQEPTIELIEDSEIVDIDDEYYLFVDSGQSSLSTLTLEEYNGLGGLRIIPKVLESKFDYLFAANIKDEQSLVDDYIREFDARTYSADENGQIILYDSAFQNVEQQFTFEELQNGSVNSLKISSDCCNLYTYMEEDWPQIMENAELGSMCRYDSEGYYGGEGKYIKWRFIETELGADYSKTSRIVGQLPTNIGSVGNSIDKQSERETGSYIYTAWIHKDNGLVKTNYDSVPGYTDMSRYYDNSGYLNYWNPIISYALKSLKRNELYRYGIILYNGKGAHSSVMWIQDIRTPNSNYEYCNAFLQGTVVNNEDCDLSVRPLGIEFKVDIDKFNEYLTLHKDELDVEWDDDLLITHYEIVRCNRTEQDICNISQGVISRPIRKYHDIGAIKENIQQYPYVPTGYLTTANFWHGKNFTAYQQSSNSGEDSHESANYENHTLFQFVSPEVLFQKDYINDLFKSNNIYISPIEYLFHRSVNYSPDNYYVCRYDTSVNVNGSNQTIDGVGRFSQTEEYNGSKITFVQGGYSNMQLPLFIQESNHRDWIGDSENDSTYVGGISLLSIFYPTSTSVPSWYVAWPSETVGWDWAIGHVGEKLTTSYVDTSGHTQYINLDWQNSRSDLQLIKYQYGYSKLYQQSYNVFLRDYSDATLVYYDEIVGDKVRYDECDLRKQTESYEISEFAIANEISWDGFFEDVDNDGDVTTQWKVLDNQQSIGGYTYVNATIWSMYDNSDSIEELTNTNGFWIGNGRTTNAPLGPAGRCMILSIPDDNIFYKTICTNKMYVGQPTNEPIVNARTYDATTDLNNYANSSNGISLHVRNNENYGINSGKTNRELYEQLPDGTDIFRNSICGTYLCNIKQKTSPYGGYGYQSRRLNSYYSYGDIYKAKETAIVFDGDCIIAPLEYISMMKSYYSRIKYPCTSMIAYSIPVETNINVYFQHGYEFSDNLNVAAVSNLQTEPANVYSYFTQTEPLYNYNTVYSANTYLDQSVPMQYDSESNLLNNLDYRCYNSNPKTNNENIDSWTTFMPNNYIDVDTRYGEITELKSFKDKLFFWQNDAIGLLSVNERSQVVDVSDQELILGTGGVLSRYDYIDQTSGMSKELYCDTNSLSTLYWYDDKNKELKSYGQSGYVLLNDTHSTKTLMQKSANDDNPVMFYDDLYLELVSKVLNESNSLTYNERYNMFTSVYEMPFVSVLKFGNKIQLLTNDENNIQIYQWNQLTGKQAVNTLGNVCRKYVQFVVNKNPLITKTYDNQEIITSELSGYNSFDKQYFNINHKYTWETDLNYSETDNLEYTDREGNFRYCIPRALDEDGNIVPYGNRMRGKYMICSIEDKENKYDTSISYIITKFRQSWT